MSDGDVDQNSAGGDALDTSYFTRTHIERVGFHTNRATGTDGRASSLFVGPEATVRQSTFEGNTCAGGASYWPSVIAVANQRSLTLDDVDFTNNTCTAVYASASAVVNITNSSFTGGRSDNLPAAIYMGPIAGYTTAGVVGSLTVSDTTFTDNWNRGASARGGAVFLNSPVGGGAPNPTIIASFTDSSFTQNRADIGGGAIDIFNTVRLTLDGASFTDNNGALGASSLQMRGDAPWPKATLTECIFEEDPSFEISNNGAAHNLTDGTHTLTCGTYNCSIP